MSAREIQDQKSIAREMFVQQAAHANADVSASVEESNHYQRESTGCV
jgi:hypothetical protein